MLTDFMLTQSAKASFPIVSTLLEIVADIKLWQPEKAPMPMLATLLGMIIDAKPKQLVKALLPMLVTLFGIDVFLQPSMSVLLDFSMIALQPISVFAKYCIPIRCTYKGRKMILVVS